MPLQIYTGRVNYDGKDRLDVTVKSGIKAFAPTWDMVMGHKQGTISDAEYTERYIAILEASLNENKQEWAKLLAMKTVVLLCYCRAGVFCHRKILAEFIMSRFTAQYRGEI